MKDIAKEFAKRGYVVFLVEYRRGRIPDLNNTYTSVQQQLAAYRACQDGRGAIRSIIQRQQNHNSDFSLDPYQIDLDKIFIGGASAGGVIAMISAWYTPQMVYSAFPTPAGYTDIQTALGDIDIDYYYGNVNLDYKPYIKGVLNMWGAIPIPYGQNQVTFFRKLLSYL